MEGANYEKAAIKLVDEMGFSRTEVDMALKDTSGNVEMAIQKLIAGAYKPPPYTAGAEGAPGKQNESGEKGKKMYPSMPKFLSSLTNRDKKSAKVEFDPTAPPLFDSIAGGGSSSVSSSSDGPDFSCINSLPPPYVKHEKESKIKEWEQDMNVVYVGDRDKERLTPAEVAMFGGQEKRCPVCFNALTGNSMSSTGPQEHIISQDDKFFHYSCFTRKHGPKCSYCYFPLAQADKDHELSGKYLVYNNKDYHVECYEKYAGPRCSACFNVIIERPNGEYSGNFVVDKHQEFHVECLQKKMYAAWRAKHS